MAGAARQRSERRGAVWLGRLGGACQFNAWLRTTPARQATTGTAARFSAWCVGASQAGFGLSPTGIARTGSEWHGRLGSHVPNRRGRGSAGASWLDAVSPGYARHGRRGWATLVQVGPTRLGRLGEVRLVEAKRGPVWPGRRRPTCPGEELPDIVQHGNAGGAWQRSVRRRALRLILVRLGMAGEAAAGLSWCGADWLGRARQARPRQATSVRAGYGVSRQAWPVTGRHHIGGAWQRRREVLP